MVNIPFSITAHGQDFMADLGNDDLLREICYAAEFVAVETEYSRGLMARRCPGAADKIHRVYNELNLANFFRAVVAVQTTGPVHILSVGRLVAFKGFEYLIELANKCGSAASRSAVKLSATGRYAKVCNEGSTICDWRSRDPEGRFAPRSGLRESPAL